MFEPTPADDLLHRPTSNDPFWTETAWFAFAIPERRLTGAVYPLFRANQGVCSAGVYVWDDTSPAAHEILYQHNYWHLPMPAELNPMRLANGLTYEVLEPLRTHRVTYRCEDELEIDLVYQGLVPPVMNATGNHVDQPCHVTGTVQLNGDVLDVDCYEMRDKSWSVRSDAALRFPQVEGSQYGVSYTYGLSAATSFLMYAKGLPATTAGDAGSGFILREGLLSPVARGTRCVERPDGGTPERVVIDVIDELGRSLHAVGECVNTLPLQVTPGILVWMRGTIWTIDGDRAWGEDQELVGRPRRMARS